MDKVLTFSESACDACELQKLDKITDVCNAMIARYVKRSGMSWRVLVDVWGC